jgi:transcriptional regulator with XRE-family HTH domain
MDVQHLFGKNVRRLRTATGMSQDAFADFVGVHRTYLSGIERGVRAPSIVIVDRLAKALNVEAGVLFAEDDEQTVITC